MSAWTVPNGVARWRRRGAIAAAVGLLASLVVLLLAPERLLLSWLHVSVLCLGFSLGAMGLVFLHGLTGGAWGVLSRRAFEAAALTLPVALVALVPAILFHATLRTWHETPAHGHHATLPGTPELLSGPFFIGRGLLCLVAWALLAFAIERRAREMDAGVDEDWIRRQQGLSAAGLLVLAFTVTIAATDWLMSLQEEWFSHVVGFHLLAGQGVAALSLAILTAWALTRAGTLENALKPSHWQDLGNLLLAFVMVWAYLALSQFLIIWSGDLPGEVTWYVARSEGPWPWAAALLVLLHFAVPFALLISRETKRRPERLAAVAGLLLVARALDLWWQSVPSVAAASPLHPSDVAAWLALGGASLVLFLHALSRRPVLATGDPRLSGVLSHD